MSNKLNAFAELIAEGKRQKALEQGKALSPQHPHFKQAINKPAAQVAEEALKPVQNTPQPAVDTNASAGEEKRFEKLLKQLQNDFVTLKRYVDNIPKNTGGYGGYGGGGSGEVKIARMDDISKVKALDGDTLVWNSATNMFEYAPALISKTPPLPGDTLVWNATTGVFEPVPINTLISDEEMPFAKRVDFVGSTTIYKGEAVVGAAETDPVWRIHKLTLGVDDDVVEVWAGGVSTYTNTWADRLTYTYS
jgi:hypothetical protein